MTATRAGCMVVFLALAAYVNSLGNGFAYDDEGIVLQNPVVTDGNWREALTSTWWPEAEAGTGLYRPSTAASFAVEWRLFRGSPLGYHALNLAFHALGSVLVFLLLLELSTLPGALFGAALFAVHPLHTEAVANVVGRAELYSAVPYLLACILYWRGRKWRGMRRIGRLLGLGALYLLSLAGKEIGVTLPGALLLLELSAPALGGDPGVPALERLGREAATFLLLGVVLVTYLGVRYLVLGTLGGELEAPIFQLVGSRARALTAVALWIQYLRLMLFPIHLASDYDPGVLFPSEGLDTQVFLGAGAMVALAWLAIRSWKTRPLVSLGILWFAVSILPVSNLFFPTGVLLAERTLYLPSVGLSFVAAGATGWVLSLSRFRRRVIGGVAMVAGLALFVRTVERNPSWMSTFVVQQALNEDHPEAWRAIRARAQGLVRVGETSAAARFWDRAVLLSPMNYTLLAQVGDFYATHGDSERGEAYFRRAIQLQPRLANAYQLLAADLLRQGRGREAHRTALEGLRQSGPDRELWALVSESYILKGDLPAAVRAREAAIGADPGSADQWSRMAEILQEMGEGDRAAVARDHAASLRAVQDESRGALPGRGR